MSNLSKIIYARGITPNDLATLTGLTYPTIWRLLKNDCYATAQKSTQQKIAAVLGVSVSELVKGGKRMKNKILEAEVRKAIEHLTTALHKYTDEPMYLSLAIFTKDKTVRTETDPEGIPDYYTVRSYVADTEQEHTADDLFVPKETVIDESARVYYGEEGIRQVIPFER